VLAHNIARWTLRAAGGDWADATAETFRRKIVSMPARLVNTARTIKLRFPRNWPWADAYDSALTTIRAIPAPT
jgi:hypothetical protein